MSYFKFGQRHIVIGAMISLVGGATAFAISVVIMGNSLFGGEDRAFLAVAFAGAFVAGVILAAAFGQSGRKGWMWAAFGALGTTALGAFLGGLMMFQNVYDAMFCIVMIFALIATTPLVAMAWLILMAAVHHVARRLVLVAEIPADLDLIPGPDDL